MTHPPSQMKEKKIRLTKKKLKALDIALSIDDVLYEKFRRLNEDLQKRAERMYKANQVIQVIKNEGSAAYIQQIVREIKTDKGIIVYIK